MLLAGKRTVELDINTLPSFTRLRIVLLRVPIDDSSILDYNLRKPNLGADAGVERNQGPWTTINRCFLFT